MRRVSLGAGVAGVALYAPLGRLISPAVAQTTTSVADGLLVGNVSDITGKGSVLFTDPATGDPAVALKLASGEIVSYDAVCTHAGCTVQYDSQQLLLVCPCHGSAFDPAQMAAVVAGPAPAPLIEIPVRVAANGDIYAMDVPAPTPTDTPTSKPTSIPKPMPTARPKPTITPTRRPRPRPRPKKHASHGTSHLKHKKTKAHHAKTHATPVRHKNKHKSTRHA